MKYSYIVLYHENSCRFANIYNILDPLCITFLIPSVNILDPLCITLMRLSSTNDRRVLFELTNHMYEESGKLPMVTSLRAVGEKLLPSCNL